MLRKLILVAGVVCRFAAAEEAAEPAADAAAKPAAEAAEPAAKVVDGLTSDQRETMESGAEKHEFQAEVSRLMDIIINSLYTDKNVFLRELISNAADALEKTRFLSVQDETFLGDTKDLEIKIEYDQDAKTLSLTDTGVGMSKADLINNLGTVAKSGTTNFLEAMAEGGDANLIGQFGVGFYSAFLVADKVTVTSKSNDDDTQHIWESSADASFAIAEDPRGNTLGRGSRVTLHLKEDALDFLNEHKLKEITSKFSQFIQYPIYIMVKKEVEVEEEDDDDEETEDDDAESKDGEDKEEKKEKEPKEKKKQIVNVSREQLQQNKIMKVITKKLVRKILELLKKLAKDSGDGDEEDDEEEGKEGEEKKEEKKKKEDGESAYDKFYKEFGKNMKMGCYEDDSNRSKISKLLRFTTTKSEGKEISLDKYLDNMSEKQEQIYYLSGEDLEIMDKLPNLQIFKKKNIEVLLLTDHLDEPCLQKLADYEGKKFISIQKADVKLDETEDEIKRFNKMKDMYKPLTDWWKGLLTDLTEKGNMKQSGVKIDSVTLSKRLVKSPCVVVSSQFGYSAHQEKIMRAQAFQNKDQIQMMAGRKTLEVNGNHPVIYDLLQKVKDSKDDAKAKQTAETLFQTAMIESGFEINDPSDLASRVYKLMSQQLGIDPDEPVREIELPEDEEEEAAEDDKSDEEETKEEEDKKEEEEEDKKEEEEEEEKEDKKDEDL